MSTRQEPERIPIVESGPFADFPIISTYSRAEAIADGVLIDVSETATECGFPMSVAVTASAWADYIVPDERSRKFGQSEQGRLWDALSILKLTIPRKGKGKNSDALYFQDTLYFHVMFVLKKRQRRLIELKCQCGPGDSGELVLTIMTPNES